MNFRTTVILLILLIGAGTFFIVSNSSDPVVEDPKKKDVADEKGRKLFDVKLVDLKKVSITPAAGVADSTQALELTKVDGEWKLAKPIDWPADGFEGQNLVSNLVEMRSTATIDVTDKNRDGTGMAKPRYTVELTDTAGKVTKMYIGEEVLGRLYVRVGDDTKTASVVTDRTVSERFKKGTDELIATVRDKKLVDISTFDAKQMEITVGGRKLSLVKESNAWKITSPAAVAADMSEVSDIVTTISNLRADQFATEQSATSRGARFEQPRAIVTLSDAAPATQPATSPSATQPAGKTVTVVIGQPTDITGDKAWVKVSRPASVAMASLNKTSYQKIAEASVLSLRDRRVVDIDPEQVSEFTLVTETASATQPSQKQSTKVERRKENLELGPVLPKAGPSTAPATNPAPTTKPATPGASGDPSISTPVSEVRRRPGFFGIAALARNPGPREYAQRPASLQSLVGMLSLTSLLQTEGSPATKPVEPASKPAPSATTQATTKPAAATQPATAPATQPAAPIEAPEPPPPPKTKWVVTSAKGADGDDAAVSALLFDLHPLRATKYLEAMPPAPAGTQPATMPTTTVYVLTIKSVAAGGAAKTHELRITDRGGETKPIGQYDGLIFELERSFLEKLKENFIFDPTKPPKMPSPPPGMPPGFPGGGFPGGFPGGLPE